MKKGLLGILFAAAFILAASITVLAAEYTVTGTKNYLALRSTPATTTSNEIGKLYNGDTFTVTEFTSNNFAYGYAKGGDYGYVNAKYLTKSNGATNNSTATLPTSVTNDMYGVYYLSGYNNPGVSEAQRQQESIGYLGSYIEVVNSGDPNAPIFRCYYPASGASTKTGYKKTRVNQYPSHGANEIEFHWSGNGDAEAYYSIWTNGNVVMHALYDNSEVIYSK